MLIHIHTQTHNLLSIWIYFQMYFLTVTWCFKNIFVEVVMHLFQDWLINISIYFLNVISSITVSVCVCVVGLLMTCTDVFRGSLSIFLLAVISSKELEYWVNSDTPTLLQPLQNYVFLSLFAIHYYYVETGHSPSFWPISPRAHLPPAQSIITHTHTHTTPIQPAIA